MGRPALGPNQPLIQWVLRVLMVLGVLRVLMVLGVLRVLMVLGVLSVLTPKVKTRREQE
jgi:hypothetical protein